MTGENKLKFKFNPTPTLAKLYEQQGLYQDAIRIYEYLTESGKYNFALKVLELKAKLNPDYMPESDEVSLTEIVIAKADDKNKEKIIFEVHSPEESADHDNNIGEEKAVILPEYDSLINILFNDEEKSYFKIVPSEEFYYNKNKELVSIFTKREKDKATILHSEEKVKDKAKKGYHEILTANNDINPEVTVEDFVNILYTYYSKETKISEIKIGDLFLLLSSIKIENS